MQHCGVRRNCAAHSQHLLDLCYFAISISQLCEQEQLNISQSKPKLQTVKVSRLYSHWLRIGDWIWVVPLFFSWDQLFAGAPWGSQRWPRTCGAKIWSSTHRCHQTAKAESSNGPRLLSHWLKNCWCTDIYLQNKHSSVLFCLFEVFLVDEGSLHRSLHNLTLSPHYSQTQEEW